MLSGAENLFVKRLMLGSGLIVMDAKVPPAPDFPSDLGLSSLFPKPTAESGLKVRSVDRLQMRRGQVLALKLRDEVLK